MSILDSLFRPKRQPDPQQFVSPQLRQVVCGVAPSSNLFIQQLEASIRQLRFLLSQAPMLTAPKTLQEAMVSQAPFAYIHPKTFAGLSPGKWMGALDTYWGSVPGSPSRWIITSLMPEDRVIYSPNALPGMDKILGTAK